MTNLEICFYEFIFFNILFSFFYARLAICGESGCQVVSRIDSRRYDRVLIWDILHYLFCGLGFFKFIWLFFRMERQFIAGGNQNFLPNVCWTISSTLVLTPSHCHVLAWKNSSLLDNAPPILEKYYNACSLQFLISRICVFVCFSCKVPHLWSP